MEWYRKLIWGLPTSYQAEALGECTKASVDRGREAGSEAGAQLALPAGARARIGTHSEGLTPPSAQECPTELTVVHVPAPGHCDDHSVFFVPEIETLFSADLYLSSKPLMSRFDEDVMLHMATLERVLRLPFKHLFCAHRGHVPKGRAALQARLDHLRDLRKKVHRILADDLDNKETPRSVARQVLGREPFLAYFTGMHFSKANLVTCLAQGYETQSLSRMQTGQVDSTSLMQAKMSGPLKQHLGVFQTSYGPFRASEGADYTEWMQLAKLGGTIPAEWLETPEEKAVGEQRQAVAGRAYASMNDEESGVVDSAILGASWRREIEASGPPPPLPSSAEAALAVPHASPGSGSELESRSQ